MLIEIYSLPHYVAPFTVAFFALGLQAARHLRVWRPGGQPVGKTMLRLVVVACVAMVIVQLAGEPHHFRFSSPPVLDGKFAWSGGNNFGEARDYIEAGLEALPGRQLVIVRYAPEHNLLDDWVYNRADINNSKVIWAREMSPAQDRELMDYYKDRKVWLSQPDLQPTTIEPYPAAALNR